MKMKKISVILLIAMTLSMTGCTSSENLNTGDEIVVPGSDVSLSAPGNSGSDNGTQQPADPTPAATPEPTAIPAPQRESNIDPNLSAEELFSRIVTGWNLGNTFDATGSPGSRLSGNIDAIETSWLGGAAFKTTQSLIQTVKNAGFEILRIPVSWAKVADPDDDWRIREDWLARIKEVADWALEEDMYVIINIHHDNESLKLGIDGADSPDHPGRYFAQRIWTQIAETFIDYDERLIFETLNEPRHEGGSNEWWGATQEVRNNINYINQAIVDAIRATGGSNQHRILMVPTQAAGISPNALKDMLIPDDPGNSVNKIALSIHTYSPFNWAHDGRGSYEDEGLGGITGPLDTVRATADRLGVPVVLGEWGTNHASIGQDENQDLRNAQRPVHAEDYVREARERGMVTIWWDNGGFNGKEHTWGIIRRDPPHEISALHQQVIDGIMRGAGN